MKYVPLMLSVILVACSTSQFTMYKPPDEVQGWKIDVKKSGDTFEVKIDGASVVKDSYALFGSQFEGSGEYKGHKVTMFGYRTMSAGVKGDLVVTDQIRVFVDYSEIGKFDFTF